MRCGYQILLKLHLLTLLVGSDPGAKYNTFFITITYVDQVREKISYARWKPVLLNERVFSIDDHIVNNRRVNLKDFLSGRHTLFQQWFEKEALKFYCVSHFYLTVVVKTLRWF